MAKFKNENYENRVYNKLYVFLDFSDKIRPITQKVRQLINKTDGNALKSDKVFTSLQERGSYYTAY